MGSPHRVGWDYSSVSVGAVKRFLRTTAQDTHDTPTKRIEQERTGREQGQERTLLICAERIIAEALSYIMSTTLTSYPSSYQSIGGIEPLGNTYEL